MFIQDLMPHRSMKDFRGFIRSLTLLMTILFNLYHCVFRLVDRAGGGVYIGQGHGIVPLHAGKRCVWEVLQAASGPQAAHQQERLWWLWEEHDLQAQGEQECDMIIIISQDVGWMKNLQPSHVKMLSSSNYFMPFFFFFLVPSFRFSNLLKWVSKPLRI